VSDVVELNVGGVTYTTSRPTLTHDKDSLLAKWFGSTDADENPPVRDGQGRYFIDRDGALFHYINHVDADADDSEEVVRTGSTRLCSATSSIICAVVSSSFPSRSVSAADFAKKPSSIVSPG